MKRAILTVLLLLCLTGTTRANGFWHDQYVYFNSVTGYWLHPSYAGNYTRTSYYYAPSGYGCCYRPGYTTYYYTPVVVAVPVAPSFDDALKAYDLSVLEDARRKNAFQSRGIVPSPQLVNAFTGAYGAQYSGSYSKYTDGYGQQTLNQYSSATPLIDLNAALNQVDRGVALGANLYGQQASDRADLVASAIEAEKTRLAIEGVLRAKAGPATTVFREFKLTVSPQGAITGGTPDVTATIDSDPAIKAGITTLTALGCATCHGASNTSKTRFLVSDFFALPTKGGDNDLTYLAVRKWMTDPPAGHPRMPKGGPAATAEQLAALDAAHIRARAMAIPTKVIGGDQLLPPANPMGPANKE